VKSDNSEVNAFSAVDLLCSYDGIYRLYRDNQLDRPIYTVSKACTLYSNVDALTAAPQCGETTLESATHLPVTVGLSSVSDYNILIKKECLKCLI